MTIGSVVVSRLSVPLWYNRKMNSVSPKELGELLKKKEDNPK
jgi:hypothetical protein